MGFGACLLVRTLLGICIYIYVCEFIGVCMCVRGVYVCGGCVFVKASGWGVCEGSVFVRGV